MSKIGEYIKRDHIGKGTFGNVYTGYLEWQKKADDIQRKDWFPLTDTYKKRKPPKDIVAIKKIDLQKCGEKDKQRARDEVQTLKSLNHEHMVQYRDSFAHKHYLCIVMEYCKGGTLRQYIDRQPDQITEDKCKDILRQLTIGVKYLHSKNIIHRDLKPKNIFLTEEETIKIGDLGTAKLLQYSQFQQLSKEVGTPYYMSPEMINGKPYDQKTDMWSLGCCVYEIATKEVAFSAASMKKIRDAVSSKQLSEELRSIPYSDSFLELIAKMLRKEPEQRPTPEDILSYIGRPADDTIHSEGPKERINVGAKTPALACPPGAGSRTKESLLSMSYPGTKAMADQFKEKRGKWKQSRKNEPYQSDSDHNVVATSDLGDSTSTLEDTGTADANIRRLETLRIRQEDKEEKVERIKRELAKEIGENTVSAVLELIDKEHKEESYTKTLRKLIGKLFERNKADLLSLRIYVLDMKGQL